MDQQAGPPTSPAAGAAQITIADQFVLLRRAWFDVVSDVDPDDRALLALISERLDAFETAGVVPGESELLKTAEDAAQVSLASVSADQARVLSRRLRRGVYEFLLAIDAAGAPAPPAAAEEESAPDARADSHHRAMLIGLEEVTGLLHSNGGGRPELVWDEPSISQRAPLESLSPPDPERPDLWPEFAAAASLSIVDAPADGTDPETPDDGGETIRVAEEPAAERPVLHVVDSDLATGLGAGQGLPGAADHPAFESEDAVRVPPSFRREPSGPPPLVVPSYRAWADVLASASDTAATPSTTAGPAGLVGPAVAGGPWLQAAPSRREPIRPEPGADAEASATTDALEPGDAMTPDEAASAGVEPAAVDEPRAVVEPDTETAESAIDAVPIEAATDAATVVDEPTVTDEAPPAAELVALVELDAQGTQMAASDATAEPSEPEPPGPIPDPQDPPIHAWTAPLPSTTPDKTDPAPAAEEPAWAPAEERQAQPDWPMSAGPSAATGWPGTPPAWSDGLAGGAAFGGEVGARDWPAETEEPDHEGDHGGDAAGGWSIRSSPRQQLLAERMAEKRRQEAERAATEAMLIPPSPPEGRRNKRRGLDGERISRDTVRTDVEDMLRRRKGSDAAALLQRAAQEMGGRDIADLALDSGDRCRALGQQRAAINCFLAAWRSDPIYETPLWRLADACLTDRSVELAVGYLERIADLMRARADDEGAMGVYRKIVAVAPDRADIRELLRNAQVSGRLAP